MACIFDENGVVPFSNLTERFNVERIASEAHWDYSFDFFAMRTDRFFGLFRIHAESSVNVREDWCSSSVDDGV